MGFYFRTLTLGQKRALCLLRIPGLPSDCFLTRIKKNSYYVWHIMVKPWTRHFRYITSCHPHIECTSCSSPPCRNGFRGAVCPRWRHSPVVEPEEAGTAGWCCQEGRQGHGCYYGRGGVTGDQELPLLGDRGGLHCRCSSPCWVLSRSWLHRCWDGFLLFTFRCIFQINPLQLVTEVYAHLCYWKEPNASFNSFKIFFIVKNRRSHLQAQSIRIK